MKNRKFIKLAGIGAAVFILLILAFFIFRNQATAPTENKVINNSEVNSEASNSTQLANPASQNCEKLGGELVIKTRGDGGQYGVCELKNGMVCEEWALYRGECPVEGVDTVKLDSEIQKYCVWLGGELDNVNQNTCTLASGKVCDTSELYNGSCPTN